MITLQAEVKMSVTYCEPEHPSDEAPMCIEVVATRTDGLGEWRTCLTIKEAADLREKLYVAICAAYGVTA